MKRIIFQKGDLSNLPIPEEGFFTLAVNEQGGLSTVSSDGSITHAPVSYTHLTLPTSYAV